VARPRLKRLPRVSFVFGLLCMLVLLTSIFPDSVRAQAYSMQVNADGDTSALGSVGARVEIRTHLYQVDPTDADSFWVQASLQNGSFVQFGYAIYPAGTWCNRAVNMRPGKSFECLTGNLTVDGSEAIWAWTYFHDSSGNLYDHGIGHLSGVNGTWHEYRMESDLEGLWGFFLDGVEVAHTSVQTSEIRAIALSAEKTTLSITPGPLGPVEFRNLSYLDRILGQNTWFQVMTLTADTSCSVNAKCLPISYGIALLGPNDVIAGTSIPQPVDRTVLWSNSTEVTATRISQSALFWYERLAIIFVGGLILTTLYLRKRYIKSQKDADR